MKSVKVVSDTEQADCTIIWILRSQYDENSSDTLIRTSNQGNGFEACAEIPAEIREFLVALASPIHIPTTVQSLVRIFRPKYTNVFSNHCFHLVTFSN